MIDDTAEVPRERGVVLHQRARGGLDVVQAADRIAAAAGQVGIARRGDAERSVEIGGGDQRVVGGRLVAELAEVVAAVHGDLRRELMLHRRLPLDGGAARVPAVQRPGILRRRASG